MPRREHIVILSLRPLLSLSCRATSHARLSLRPDVAPCYFQFVIGLQIEPDLRRDAEILAEAQRGVGSDGALAVYDLADTVRWHIEIPCQRIDADTERLHELLAENLSGGNRVQTFRRHTHSSVIVDNLDLLRVAVLPPKADAPLVVDANAVLTLSVTAQCFEPIARRDAQVPNRACSM